MLFCIVSRRHPTEVWDRRKQETGAKGVIELRISGVTNLQRVIRQENGTRRHVKPPYTPDGAHNNTPRLKCRIVMCYLMGEGRACQKKRKGAARTADSPLRQLSFARASLMVQTTISPPRFINSYPTDWPKLVGFFCDRSWIRNRKVWSSLCHLTHFSLNRRTINLQLIRLAIFSNLILMLIIYNDPICSIGQQINHQQLQLYLSYENTDQTSNRRVGWSVWRLFSQIHFILLKRFCYH